MIQERPSLPACPYCGAALPYWPRGAPVHGCRTCLRPLVIVPGTVRRPPYYRIHTLFGIVKILTALGAIFIIAALGFGLASPSARVAMTIMAFFVHGSMDMADGILGLKTGIDRTWNRQTPLSASKIGAILKLAFGLLLLGGTALGLSIRACGCQQQTISSSSMP